jgi:hypothetical protein
MMEELLIQSHWPVSEITRVHRISRKLSFLNQTCLEKEPPYDEISSQNTGVLMPAGDDHVYRSCGNLGGRATHTG